MYIILKVFLVVYSRLISYCPYHLSGPVACQSLSLLSLEVDSLVTIIVNVNVFIAGGMADSKGSRNIKAITLLWQIEGQRDAEYRESTRV